MNQARSPHNNTSQWRAFTLLPLACVVALDAGAQEFEWGEVSGRYNGSLGVGAIWNAEKPNGNFIYQGNANSIGYGAPGQFNPNGGKSGDDSRLNFRKRNLVSSPITLLGEVELNWRNYGAFVRGKAWYDYTLDNREVDFGHAGNGYQPNSKLNDDHFDDLAKFQGVALMDAYVFGDFDLVGHPLNARLGNQVVNWGEGLFLQNGLNVANPVDVAALRRPGSQLKEALIPVPMLYFNFGLTDALSLEAFYQFKWRRSVLEGCGTFFAANDFLSGGEQGCFGVSRSTQADPQTYANDLYLHRAEDHEASDQGQFGLALRYFADSIDTEFGAYAMNIHSRLPYASVITDTRPAVGAGWLPGQQASNAQYFADFPEDIRVLGLSFSTTLWGASVFGEYSYRPNQPVQLTVGDLMPAFAGNPAATGALIGQSLTLGEDAINAPPGSTYNGYDRLRVSQLSLGMIKSFPQVLGADNFSLTGEVGMKYIHNLSSLDERRYIKTDIYGSDLANGNATGCALGGPVQRYKQFACSTDGYATDFAWGYRLRAQLNYLGLFAGVNVAPFLAFGQDVKGWSYDANFVEGRLLGALGVRADYLQNYSAELSWSATGNTPYAATDKDFIALSLRMGF
ncbi:DUF1302 domain-containing protein [Pseudomonas sp. NPDC090755]|uniref:DUF1302 domain-containing protein n=1 Tax=Pseudomonas sp. NPDC090755 TaxID=3364481 RepID=UPI00383AF0DB